MARFYHPTTDMNIRRNVYRRKRKYHSHFEQSYVSAPRYTFCSGSFGLPSPQGNTNSHCCRASFQRTFYKRDERQNYPERSCDRWQRRSNRCRDARVTFVLQLHNTSIEIEIGEGWNTSFLLSSLKALSLFQSKCAAHDTIHY